MQLKLHHYQKQLLNLLIKGQKQALFLDMGMGKTPLTLAYIWYLFSKRKVNKVLVVAPLRVASTTWVNECQKWDQFKDFKVINCCGSAAKRKEAFKKEAHIYTINRENCKWLVQNVNLEALGFDMLVIDELSSFKSTGTTSITNEHGRNINVFGSQRFIALKQIRHIFKYVIGLTGTPMPNGYLELWPQIYLLDQGKTFGENFYRFRQQHFTENIYTYSWNIKPGSENIIKNKVDDIAVSLKAEDYLQMPDKIYNNITLELDPKATKKYLRMKEDMYFNNEDEGEVINSENVVIKLLQLASGFIYDENKKIIRVHNIMLDALEEVIEFTQGNILLFYNFQAEAGAIIEKFPEARLLNTPESLDSWCKGDIKLAISHPASTGHGLNLQSGGNTIVWYGPNWSSELTQQAEGRLYRQGQESKSVTIHRLLVKDTIHNRVMDLLSGKITKQDLLIESCKMLCYNLNDIKLNR